MGVMRLNLISKFLFLIHTLISTIWSTIMYTINILFDNRLCLYHPLMTKKYCMLSDIQKLINSMHNVDLNSRNEFIHEFKNLKIFSIDEYFIPVDHFIDVNNPIISYLMFMLQMSITFKQDSNISEYNFWVNFFERFIIIYNHIINVEDNHIFGIYNRDYFIL